MQVPKRCKRMLQRPQRVLQVPNCTANALITQNSAVIAESGRQPGMGLLWSKRTDILRDRLNGAPDSLRHFFDELVHRAPPSNHARTISRQCPPTSRFEGASLGLLRDRGGPHGVTGPASREPCVSSVGAPLTLCGMTVRSCRPARSAAEIEAGQVRRPKMTAPGTSSSGPMSISASTVNPASRSQPAIVFGRRR